MSGYVRLYRALFGHPAFRNESETMAFAWMIGKAAWRQTRVRYKGHSITLKRGQLAISQRDMAAAFDRDKAWIERLWKRCKLEAMIEVATEAGVAVITICNYDEYQAENDDGEAPRKASHKADNEAAARQRRGTEQRREEGNNSSEGKPSAGEPPANRAKNQIKELFDLGVSILTESGADERKARSLIGRWKKDRGEAEVLQALLECQRGDISEPVEWLTKRLQKARYVSKSGYEYRGDQEAVLREADKRGDMDTYWRVKGDMGRERAAPAGASR